MLAAGIQYHSRKRHFSAALRGGNMRTRLLVSNFGARSIPPKQVLLFNCCIDSERSFTGSGYLETGTREQADHASRLIAGSAASAEKILSANRLKSARALGFPMALANSFSMVSSSNR